MRARVDAAAKTKEFSDVAQGQDMKTSVIEVHDLLAVLSLEEVEKRIGQVPGAQSVTVNYAARNATVRYEETRLDFAHLKSILRQRGFDAAAAPPGDERDSQAASGASSSDGASSAEKPERLRGERCEHDHGGGEVHAASSSR